jgi:glycogen debranching enzyme
MPLTFNSKSHGSIPIGFFNIESDMILINHYFLFADDFCRWIIEWATGGQEISDKKNVYVIHQAERIGDLMGAIHGIRYTGFMGALYKIFPFPEKEEGFRQNPKGDQTRSVVESLVQKYAESEEIPIMISRQDESIRIGEYVFSPKDFHEVIQYVGQGGMPKWAGNQKPGYVSDMLDIVASSNHWLFKGSI